MQEQFKGRRIFSVENTQNDKMKIIEESEEVCDKCGKFMDLCDCSQPEIHKNVDSSAADNFKESTFTINSPVQEIIKPDPEFVNKEIKKIRREIFGGIDADFARKEEGLKITLKEESAKALISGDYSKFREIKDELDFIKGIQKEEKPLNLKTFMVMKEVFGRKVKREEIEEFLTNNSPIERKECFTYDIDQLLEMCRTLI